MRLPYPCLVLVAALVTVCASAFAQPRLGDVIVSDKKPLGHVLYLDRVTGQLQTILAGPISSNNRATLALRMAKNNRDMYLLEEGPPFSLWTISPTGTLTTVAPVSMTNEGVPTCCDFLQDGNLIVSAARYQRFDYLRIFDVTTNTFTSLVTKAVTTRGYFLTVRVNQDNGRLLTSPAFGSELFEYDLAGNLVGTISAALSRPTTVDVDAATGNYVWGSINGIRIVSSTGSVLRTITAPTCRRVKVDHATGNFVCVHGTGGANTITEFDRMGAAVNTWGPFTGYNFTGCDYYGSKNVVGSGSATPGSTYAVDFSFPNVGPLSYVAALSFSQRPGLTLGGSTLNLATDSLFWLSLQGVFVTGFQGVLDGTGRASGSIQIPAFIPQGVRIFCSAVATNGTSFVTGNTIGITVQ